MWEKMWIALLHSPYEGGRTGAMVEEGEGTATRGKETEQNQALGHLCPCERECMCKSVCKRVCRCADLALLSEGCIRVACRKGHRTTVVLQKGEKRNKSRRAIRIRIFSWRWKGLEERRRGCMGYGEWGCGNRRQEHDRTGGRQRGKSVVGWKKIAHTQRHKYTHNTQTPTPLLHCSPSLTTSPHLSAASLCPQSWCRWISISQFCSSGLITPKPPHQINPSPPSPFSSKRPIEE